MKKIRQIISDRAVATFLLAIILMMIMGSLRPDKSLGLYPKQYWAIKIHWKNCADGVITGDSRVLMGIAPEELEKVLPYRQIRNYGFGANWYSRQYLEATESLFLEDADNRAVFMGISAHSLTNRDTVQGHFIELSQQSKQDAFLDIHFGALVNFFEPMSFRDAMQGLIPSLAPTHTQKNYGTDGFVAVHKQPLVLDEVKRYRKIFENRKISDEVINTIMEFVKKWKSQGIDVYGFIMPSCPEMVDVEQRFSGFDQNAFVADFKRAGGTWIDVDLCKYECIDGSHLQDSGAMQFSQDLAMSIHRAEHQNTDETVNAGGQ